MENKGWQRVNSRRRSGKRRSPSRHERVTDNGGLFKEKVSRDKMVTFFFTRFPDSWDVTLLRRMFSKYGRVLDIYLAAKRTVKGTRFGFVRFPQDEKTRALERSLRSITIRSTKLVINQARFEKAHSQKEEAKKKVLKRQNTVKTIYHKSLRTRRSYKEVTMGIAGEENFHKPAKQRGSIDKPIKLFLSNAWTKELSGCWIAVAYDIEILRNSVNIFKDAGFSDFEIKHMGGLSILVKWGSKDAAAKALEENKNYLSRWFLEISMWNPDAKPTGRLAWITKV